MTIRVAVLGDSHVGCIALAARSMELGSMRPVFFADVLTQLHGLQVEGALLRAGSANLRHVLRSTSGGLETIDPQDFDLFMLVGLEFEFPFSCLREQFCSRALTEQVVRDQLSSSLAFATLKKLRKVTSRPAWFLHAPLFEPRHCERRPEVLTYARFLELASEVFQPLGGWVIPQPEATRVEDHCSLPEFSDSPVRLRHIDGSPLIVEPDNRHKNEAFGRSVIKDLLARLETFRPGEGSGFADPKPAPWRPQRCGTVDEGNGQPLRIRLGDKALELNPTAALIWECCDGSRTESEILAGLCERFAAPEDLLRRDLRAALNGLIDAGALMTEDQEGPGPAPEVASSPRIRLGLVAETTAGFLNQVKLCLFSLRKNGGALSKVPVTLITNSEPLSGREVRFFQENFSPIEFRTSPRLGAIPHTSKLNVFYSIEPSSYDVLMFMDCDTVVRGPLDRIAEPILNGDAQFLCRRGGETDRNRFVDFDALVTRFCGQERRNRIVHDGTEEWPMFNSGVFLATSEAVCKIRRRSIEFTYQLFNDWQRNNALERLPDALKKQIEIKQDVLENWPIEQGALALACIRAGVKVQYLEGEYNSWGGDPDFRILHCFKSLYKFNRPSMFSHDSEEWIAEYLDSEVPGKVFLASIISQYKHWFPGPKSRPPVGSSPS